VEPRPVTSLRALLGALVHRIEAYTLSRSRARALLLSIGVRLRSAELPASRACTSRGSCRKD
jgi:hypothetical protein